MIIQQSGIQRNRSASIRQRIIRTSNQQSCDIAVFNAVGLQFFDRELFDKD